MPGVPSQDEMVFVFNNFMSKDDDDQWSLWLEPLDRPERRFLTRGSDFEETRRKYRRKFMDLINAMDVPAHRSFLAEHAVQVRAGDIPPAEYPPKSGYRSTVETLTPGTYQRVMPLASDSEGRS